MISKAGKYSLFLYPILYNILKYILVITKANCFNNQKLSKTFAKPNKSYKKKPIKSSYSNYKSKLQNKKIKK